MTARLEDRLARVLRDRAETIVAAPAYRLVEDEVSRLRRSNDRRPATAPRRVWPLIASAAAVAALVVLALVVAGGGLGSRRSGPALDGASCDLAHSARFGAALHDGLLPAGARVLSSAPDGTALVSLDHGGTTSAVELVHRNGTVERLWTAGPGERARALANPSGAVTADAAAFVLDPSGSAAPRVIVALQTDGVTMPAPGPAAGYRFATDPLTAPVIVSDGIVMALETSTARPAQQRLDSYWRSDGRWNASAQASGTTQVLSVGGNVVLLSGADGAVNPVRFADPQYLPSTLPPAVRTGYAFSSDGTTMTWLDHQSGRPTLRHWAPGDPAPSSEPLPWNLTPLSVAGRFVVESSGSGRGILDTANGVLVQLPTGVDLLRVDGSLAVLTEQTPDGLRYSRVPTSALTAC